MKQAMKSGQCGIWAGCGGVHAGTREDDDIARIAHDGDESFRYVDLHRTHAVTGA